LVVRRCGRLQINVCHVILANWRYLYKYFGNKLSNYLCYASWYW